MDLDPVEVRRRDLLPADCFPYESPTGAVYDTGSYAAALDRALELIDYEHVRDEQAQRRAEHGPRLLGIGVSMYVEISASKAFQRSEYASVRISQDGTVDVVVGTEENAAVSSTVVCRLLRSNGMIEITCSSGIGWIAQPAKEFGLL